MVIEKIAFRRLAKMRLIPNHLRHSLLFLVSSSIAIIDHRKNVYEMSTVASLMKSSNTASHSTCEATDSLKQYTGHEEEPTQESDADQRTSNLGSAERVLIDLMEEVHETPTQISEYGGPQEKH
jgi:hypothetical protein